MGGEFRVQGKVRNGFGILIGKPKGKRSVGIPKRRWQTNITVAYTLTGWGVCRPRSLE
jgi:hypothetical protein